MRRSIRLVAALAAAALLPATLAACGNDDDDVVTDEPPTTQPADDVTPDDELPGDDFEPSQEQIDLANEVMERTAPEVEGVEGDVAPDALEITTLIEGEGPEAATGDLLLAHYAGVLADGTPFDDSWSRGRPFELQLGAGGVISGWDDGLVGAQAGERRRLVIGYENAYGPEGRPPSIPPEATLVFEIDVVAIIPSDA